MISNRSVAESLEEDIDSKLKHAWKVENKLPKSSIEHYIVQWCIEQFDYFPEGRNKSISSPSFNLDLSQTAWYIMLYPNKVLNGRKSTLYLQRHSEDKGPSTVAVTYRIGISHSDDKTKWFDERKIQNFEKGWIDGFHIPSVEEELDSLSKEMSQQNDNLILNCEMYISYEIEQNGNCLLTPADYDLVNLSHDFAKLMRSKESSDYLVKISHRDIIAHKAILAARSSVFLEELRKDMSSTHIALEDVSYLNIINLLLFIYSGNLNHVTKCELLDIGFYECAQKFSVSELERLLGPKYLYIRSTIETEELEFIWHIENFSQQTENENSITSSPFKTCHDKSQWTLTLCTKNASGGPCSLSIFAEATARTKALHTVLEISLVDEYNTLQKTKTTALSYKPKVRFGFPEFLENLSIDNSIYNFLKDDTLKIHCQLLFVVSKDMHDDHFLFRRLTPPKVSSFLNLSTDLRKFFMSGELSDVTLKTNTSLIPAHKSILFARSKVLADKFLNDAPIDGIVEISDVDPDIVSLMVDHAYSGVLEQAPTEDLVRLLIASEKYSFSSLSEICAHILGSNVNIENFFELIQLGKKLGNAALAGKCLIFAQKNSKEIQESKIWVKWRKEKKDISEFLVKWLLKHT